MTRNRSELAGVTAMALCLLCITILPFVFATPKDTNASTAKLSPKAKQKLEDTHSDAVETPTSTDGTLDGSSRKGAHGHDLDASEPHWYVTVHGGDDLANVFALDAHGKVIRGILGPVPAGEDALKELRGISLLGDGRLAVVNAYMQNSRVLLFGPPDETHVRPYLSAWVRSGPANPGFTHPYQIATSPDGTLYISNQDSNTVTRYSGLGNPQPGKPLPIPHSLHDFGTLPPGTIVPNSQHSPQGLHEVRGIAWGPDGLLYVADRIAREVVSFDPTNGQRVRVVMSAREGLGRPIQLLFTPDRQHMLIGDNVNECVWRLDMTTLKAEQLVEPESGGLKAPSALAIDGNHLLVGSRLGKQILRYRLDDGKFQGVFSDLKANPEFLISTQQK